MMKDLLEHFGGKAKLAKVMGVSRAAVSQWMREGIPAARAIEIEELTHGRFLARDIVNVKMEDSNDKQ